MSSDDSRGYYRFTKPSRVDKAFKTLSGMLEGIAMDGIVNIGEIAEVEAWASENRKLLGSQANSEVQQALKKLATEGVVDSDSLADLKWLPMRPGGFFPLLIQTLPIFWAERMGFENFIFVIMFLDPNIWW